MQAANNNYVVLIQDGGDEWDAGNRRYGGAENGDTGMDFWNIDNRD